MHTITSARLDSAAVVIFVKIGFLQSRPGPELTAARLPPEAQRTALRTDARGSRRASGRPLAPDAQPAAFPGAGGRPAPDPPAPRQPARPPRSPSRRARRVPPGERATAHFAPRESAGAAALGTAPSPLPARLPDSAPAALVSPTARPLRPPVAWAPAHTRAGPPGRRQRRREGCREPGDGHEAPAATQADTALPRDAGDDEGRPARRGCGRGPEAARAGEPLPEPPSRPPSRTHGPRCGPPHAAPAPRPTSDAAHTRRVHTAREHHGALPAASFSTAPAGPGRAAGRGCQGGGRPRSREDGERPRGPAPPWASPHPRPAAQGARRPPPPGPAPPPPPAMESPARAGRPGLGTAPRRPRLTRLEAGARTEADPTCGSRRRPLSARRRRPPPPTVTGRAPTVIPPRIPPRRDFAPDAGPQRTPALLLPQSRAARRPLGVCRGLPRVGDCGTRAEVGTALFFWADGH
nr:uncharacterized protein LOC111774799 [Equus caballus]